MKKTIVLVIILSTLALASTSCSDKRMVGAVGGAAVGGTVGGLAGGTTGAVIGGVAGAAVGSAITKK